MCNHKPIRACEMGLWSKALPRSIKYWIFNTEIPFYRVLGEVSSICAPEETILS